MKAPLGRRVARILGYRDATNASRGLKSKHLHTHPMSTSVGSRDLLLVNESGLYRLIGVLTRAVARLRQRKLNWEAEQLRKAQQAALTRSPTP